MVKFIELNPETVHKQIQARTREQDGSNECKQQTSAHSGAQSLLLDA